MFQKALNNIGNPFFLLLLKHKNTFADGLNSSRLSVSVPQVHRKTLNPVFNETFQFGVPLNELHSRKLHFSVYDFDRFSRHDLIGQVVVDNLLDFSEGSGDKPIWRDIVEGTAVREREPSRSKQALEGRHISFC